MDDQETSTAMSGRVSKRVFLTRVARRSGHPVRVVKDVYSGMLAELLVIVRSGGSLMLTGFGKFYPQPHHGHRVQFATEPNGEPKVIESYRVLKFSATRGMNRSLEETDETEVVGDPEPVEIAESEV